jgi:transcriptional regulator with XRE-family HTH domain
VEKAYTKQIKEFGQEIKRLRELKELTQQNLSDLCEIDIRTIQRIERGDSGIGLHILFALADAFEVQPFQLIKNIKLNKNEL